MTTNQNSAQIALVDDDPKIRELTAKYLSDQGLSVVTASMALSLMSYEKITISA